MTPYSDYLVPLCESYRGIITEAHFKERITRASVFLDREQMNALL